MGKSYKMYRPFRCELFMFSLHVKKLFEATATSFDCAPAITIVFFVALSEKKTLVKENSKPYEKTSLSSEAVACEW